MQKYWYCTYTQNSRIFIARFDSKDLLDTWVNAFKTVNAGESDALLDFVFEATVLTILDTAVRLVINPEPLVAGAQKTA